MKALLILLIPVFGISQSGIINSNVYYKFHEVEGDRWEIDGYFKDKNTFKIFDDAVVWINNNECVKYDVLHQEEDNGAMLYVCKDSTEKVYAFKHYLDEELQCVWMNDDLTKAGITFKISD